MVAYKFEKPRRTHKSLKLTCTLVALQLLGVLSHDCTEPSYSLSDCTDLSNFTRQAYLYFDDTLNCTDYEPTILSPIADIPCQEACSAGQYLTVDTQKRNYQCAKCPKNTYSNGGGFSIDGYFGEWNDALTKNSEMLKESWISMKCYKYFWFAWFEDDCSTCAATSGGSSYQCGEASARDTSVAFETILRLYFVKKGKIEFLYRKDSTKEKDGWISGIFSFYVDDTSVLDDNEVNEDPNEWKYFSYDLYPGMKELTFLYQKFNSEQNKNMKLEIKSLRVQGTESTEMKCQKCANGFSQEGSDRCSLCQKDTYLNPGTGECVACPEGTHSQEGSISTMGNLVCYSKKNCSLDEIPKNFSESCSTNGSSLQKSYTLATQNFTSDICAIDSSIDLTQSYQVPCEFCDAGKYFQKQEDGTYKCQKCAAKTYSSSKNFDATCLECQAGSYLQTGISLRTFERFPKEYNFTTSCLTRDGLTKAVNCTNSDGFLAKYGEGLQAGIRESVNSDIVLSADLLIIDDEAKYFNDAQIVITFETKSFSESLGDEFLIYVNNQQKLIRKSDGENTFYLALSFGKSQVKAVFSKKSASANVIIKEILIVGTSYSTPGALGCYSCPSGYFNQNDGEYACPPCPIGTTSNEKGTNCNQCEQGYYTPYQGSSCLKCPANTYPSQDKLYCIPKMHLLKENDKQQPLLYHYSFFSTNLTSSKAGLTNYTDYKLCQSQGAYCIKGFFGPVLSNIKLTDASSIQDQFFFSPLEKNDFSQISDIEFEQSEQESVSYTKNSFLIGLFDQNEVSHYSTSQGNQTTSKCPLTSVTGKNQRVIKSLGSTVQGVEILDNSFTVKYQSGDACFYQQNNYNFSSEIRFICDHEEEEGWPQQINSLKSDEKIDQCHIVFEWRSKQACRHCLSYEVTEVSGPCIWYQRENSQNPGKYCSIYSEDFINEMKISGYQLSQDHINKLEFNKSTLQACNPVQDFLKDTLLFGVLVALGGILGLLFLSCSCACCKYKRLKSQYYERVNLLRNKDPGRVSDQSREDQSQGLPPNPKRQIIYKIGDEED